MKPTYSLGSNLKSPPQHQQYRDRNSSSTLAADLSNTLTDNEDTISDQESRYHKESSWKSRLDNLVN